MSKTTVLLKGTLLLLFFIFFSVVLYLKCVRFVKTVIDFFPAFVELLSF